MAQKAGRRPVSLERDSTEAAKFAERLASTVAREDHSYRETALEEGVSTTAAVIFQDESRVPNVAVTVDATGRVLVPTTIFNGRQKPIFAIHLAGNQVAQRVVASDVRYTGTEATSIACQLESR